MRGRRRVDLTGQRFSRLVVLAYSHSASNSVWWLCKCDCGREAVACGSMLRSNRQKSCGCLKRERIIAQSTKHGHARRTGQRTRTYNSWREMVKRTTNPRHPRWADWGGRGITVCDAWRDYRQFLADMGERPPNTTLDRIDNDGNYEPGNCRWATPHQQRINRRR